MKGVAKIKGPLTPKVGETNFYEVVEFHKGTIVTDQNSIKWKLYADKDGKWAVYRDWETDRKSTRLNSSHSGESRMPSSA